MKLYIRKAVAETRERSRFNTGLAQGRITAPMLTRQLRERARAGLGEMHAEQRAVARMMRMTTETAPVERHVVLPDDITRGLGLEQHDEQRIQKAVTEANVEFNPKTQTQRIFLATGQVNELMRAMGVNGDARMEIMRRARSWWKKSFDTDLKRYRSVPWPDPRHPSPMRKGGGPFIGPRGGKWADARHTIPWVDRSEHGAGARQAAHEESAGLSPRERWARKKAAAKKPDAPLPDISKVSMQDLGLMSPMEAAFYRGGKKPTHTELKVAAHIERENKATPGVWLTASTISDRLFGNARTPEHDRQVRVAMMKLRSAGHLKQTHKGSAKREARYVAVAAKTKKSMVYTPPQARALRLEWR